MKPIEDPADAPEVLASALRVQALSPEDQIVLFSPDCVACRVRAAFQQWEDQFAKSLFAREMSRPQQNALQRLHQTNAELNVECYNNGVVCESPIMEAMREASAAALAAFDWPPGQPDLAYLYGTRECAERLRRNEQERKQQQLARRRMAPAQPQYHGATFEMLGHPLQVNQARQTEIKCWEAKHKLQLPAAVREWYAMEGPDLWARIRPRDAVPPLDDLEPLRPALVRGAEEDETFFALLEGSDEGLEMIEAQEPFSYLLVFQETDVGIPVVVRVDGSDDPPVFLQPDGGDRLEPASPRYTVFQFDYLADEWFKGWNEPAGRLEIAAPLPSEAELARLRAALTEGPQSHGGWPGWHYRFFTPDLLIACGHDYYKQPAEVPFWEIRARSDDALVEALRLVWPIANIAAQLDHADSSIALLIAKVKEK